jgi:phosphoribosylformylglycinamidine synthase
MAKAARALACVGARPQAYTDGMNLGNPYDSQTQAALKLSVEGFNDAARIFGTPCISGNVSLHNQTVDGDQKINIFPTQFIVMAGIISDIRKVTPSHFQTPGSEVWLIEVPGCTQELPFSSLYARSFWKKEIASAQILFLDLEGELRLHDFLRDLQSSSLVLSSRDIGASGLAVALAKACFGDRLMGFEGDLSKTKMRRDLLLFGEAQGRVIIEVHSRNRAQIMKLAESRQLLARKVGQVLSKPDFCLRPTLSGDSKKLYDVWSSAFI